MNQEKCYVCIYNDIEINYKILIRNVLKGFQRVVPYCISNTKAQFELWECAHELQLFISLNVRHIALECAKLSHSLSNWQASLYFVSNF